MSELTGAQVTIVTTVTTVQFSVRIYVLMDVTRVEQVHTVDVLVVAPV